MSKSTVELVTLFLLSFIILWFIIIYQLEVSVILNKLFAYNEIKIINIFIIIITKTNCWHINDIHLSYPIILWINLKQTSRPP